MLRHGDICFTSIPAFSSPTSPKKYFKTYLRLIFFSCCSHALLGSSGALQYDVEEKGEVLHLKAVTREAEGRY